jgi:hypothetical protein
MVIEIWNTSQILLSNTDYEVKLLVKLTMYKYGLKIQIFTATFFFSTKIYHECHSLHIISIYKVPVEFSRFLSTVDRSDIESLSL